jgi:hypothetical protein
MKTLPPDDDILRLVDGMGLLSLITCEVPAEIAAEREKLTELLSSNLQQPKPR